MNNKTKVMHIFIGMPNVQLLPQLKESIAHTLLLTIIQKI